jgi:hypothetical protein
MVQDHHNDLAKHVLTGRGSFKKFDLFCGVAVDAGVVETLETTKLPTTTLENWMLTLVLALVLV